LQTAGTIDIAVFGDIAVFFLKGSRMAGETAIAASLQSVRDVRISVSAN